jgi:hypothetical protein
MTLQRIAYNFIENNQELFEGESDEFETHINYMDSQVRFKSEKIQSEFERLF